MAEQFENNYSTLLNGVIDNDDTTLTVDAVPVNMTGSFRIKIESEIILVGAVSGSTFTGCTRGVEGTTAVSHADNTPVTHVLTAEGLKKLGATYIDGIEAAAPGTPSSGTARLYVKADGRWYSKDDAGVESGPFSAAGGPTLYVDTLGLTVVDDFEDMSAWTTGGSPSASSLITTEEYDNSALDLTFPSQSDRYYRAIDASFAAGTQKYYLTIHGLNNSTPDPNDAIGAMMGLYSINDSGNGSGAGLYFSSPGAYLLSCASHAYSGATLVKNGYTPAIASNMTTVFRLSTNGSTTITAGISFDGGASYYTAGITDSTTFTRIAIMRIFTSGGTNPRIRVGKLYLG